MHEKNNSPHYIIKLAQEMRRNSTPCEKILWDVLKENKLKGCKFRRQHPVNRYIIDFFCHEKKLAIEVDGDIHMNQYDQDKYRDKYLESMGIITLRVTNDEIIKNINQVLTRIMTFL